MSFFDLGPKSSETRSTSFIPSQAKALDKAISVYKPTLGKGQDVYGGDRVAPMTDLQQQSLDQAGDWLGNFQPGGTMPMYEETGTALGGILSGATGAQDINQKETDAYFKSVYEDPAMRNYQDFVKPEVREAYAGPGFWGSARAGAQAGAAQDQANWLGEQRGQLDWDVMQQNRAGQEARAGRTLQAVPQGMAYGQQPLQNDMGKLQGTKDVFAMAGQQQLQNQAEIDANIQKFIEEGRLTDPENLAALLAMTGQSMQRSESNAYYSPMENMKMVGALAGGGAMML